MRVNIYDVAYRAGVSVVTVSRVINNVPTVRERFTRVLVTKLILLML